MAATLSDYLAKSASYKNASSNSQEKFRIIGSQFSTIKGFKSATIRIIYSIKTVEGERLIKPFSAKEAAIFREIKKEIDPTISIEDNFIRLLTIEFIKKQVETVRNINIESLNTNPILGRALKFDTPKELLRYYVYSSATRGIVTSMGTLIEQLLLYSNHDVYDGKYYKEGLVNKWDIVIERLGSVKTYIEVKSGPNDMDHTQVNSYVKEIRALEDAGYKGLFGFGYGRRGEDYITTKFLQKQMEDWEEHTLIGRELWEYVSGNPGYHIHLMAVIKQTSASMLKSRSIVKLIELKIKELTDLFEKRYPNVDAYYAQLW